MEMEFGLLGSVDVRMDGRPVDVGPARQQCVLVALLVDANRGVGTDQLLDRVWGDDRPQRVRETLYCYLSRLRRSLASTRDVRIARQSGSYVLTLDPTALDLYRFHQLIRRAGNSTEDDLGLALFEQALGLWRGDPFARLDTPWLNALRDSLRRERFAAELDRNDVALRCGRHARLLPELSTQASAHPLDERLAGQLMLALHLDGRRADALSHYQRTRRLLADEVGTDPGPPLRKLHQQILTGDGLGNHSHATPSRATMSPLVPRQLPLDISTFVGRAPELARIRGILEGDGSQESGSVVVISGLAGVGKTALAVRAATLSTKHYPDGQLYVNLCGATPGVPRVSPADALGRFLRALDVPAGRLPQDLDEAAALFRTLVAGRRMLLVLDDAAAAEQILPLLPGTPENATLVTSRSSLGTLDGAIHLQISPLSPENAHAMLVRRLNDSRVSAEPAAALRLAALCDHLPLSLHIAAARLAARPLWTISSFVDRLTGESNRLAELSIGERGVQSSLAMSTAALAGGSDPADRAAAHAFALLGLLRLPEIAVASASALFDATTAEAERHIERLVDANLVEPVTAGRYRMHDLVRLFASEQANDRLPAQEASAAVSRFLGHYLATAGAAIAMLYPHRERFPRPHTEQAAIAFSDNLQAHAWLTRERANILAAVHQAFGGDNTHARLGLGLARIIFWFLFHGGYGRDCAAVYGHAITVARRLGDQLAETYALGHRAMALSQMARWDDAAALLRAELALAERTNDRFGQQRALGNLGAVHVEKGEPGQAVPYFERQLAIARKIGAEIGEAYALSRLGGAYAELGRFDEAVPLLDAALRRYRDAEDWYNEAGVLCDIAAVDAARGHVSIAIGRLHEAAACSRACNDRWGEITALLRLARIWRSHGDPESSRRSAEQAIACGTDAGMTEAVRDARVERDKAIAAMT